MMKALVYIGKITLNHIKATLRSWQSRQLSLKGKITVIKSLLVPHILQLASVTVLSEKVYLKPSLEFCLE